VHSQSDRTARDHTRRPYPVVTCRYVSLSLRIVTYRYLLEIIHGGLALERVRDIGEGPVHIRDVGLALQRRLQQATTQVQNFSSGQEY